MKLNKISLYLFFAGLILSLVGSFIALSPSAYLQQFGVSINGNQNSFFSELRGMGGGLLVFGIYILSSLLKVANQETALVLSSLVFSAFAIFRSLGILTDGMPAYAILIALSIEFIFAIGGVTLLRSKRASSSSKSGAM